MIKLFKNVDEKLADIGFKKIEENKHLCARAIWRNPTQTRSYFSFYFYV